MSEFELRQSDSSENETISVDDLMVGQTFDDVLVYAPPTTQRLLFLMVLPMVALLLMTLKHLLPEMQQ